MKISFKLNLAIIGIILGFAIGLVLLQNSLVRTSQLRELSGGAKDLIATMNRFSYTSVNMMSTIGESEAAYEHWNNSLKSLDEIGENFLNLPGVSLVSGNEEIAKLIQGFAGIKAYTLDEAETVRADIETIFESLERNNANSSNRRGFLYLEMNIIRNPDSPMGEVIINLNMLRRNLNLLAESASEVVTTSLNRLNELLTGQVVRISNQANTMAISFAMVMSLAGLIFGITFTRRLTSRINNIESIMEAVSKRNLTLRASDKTRDELGTLSGHINETLENLSDFMGHVQLATDKVSALKDNLAENTSSNASALNEINHNISGIRVQLTSLDNFIETTGKALDDINRGVGILNKNILEQAQSIENSSSAIEQMNASIESVSRVTDERKRKADELVQVIQDGGEVITSTNEIMKTISQEVGYINEIIDIINAISEQTNLLSMNAAIESAHAGEAGKGFSVVAEEIRHLADDTSENAQRIGEIIQSVTYHIDDALHASQRSANSFDIINQDVSDFAHAMTEISSSMAEISAGSREILHTTESISTITQDIRRESSKMNIDTQDIRQTMGQVERVSAAVVSGMNEIEIGSTDILKKLTDLSEMSMESSDRIENLNHLIASFTTEELSEEQLSLANAESTVAKEDDEELLERYLDELAAEEADEDQVDATGQGEPIADYDRLVHDETTTPIEETSIDVTSTQAPPPEVNDDQQDSQDEAEEEAEEEVEDEAEEQDKSLAREDEFVIEEIEVDDETAELNVDDTEEDGADEPR